MDMTLDPVAVNPAANTEPQFELRFAALLHSGRGFAFPCNASGQVALDSLSERALANYLYARAVVGRELDLPQVVPSSPAR
jgi:hypothetical protein